MTTLLYSQAICNKYKNESGETSLDEVSEAETTLQSNYQTFPSEFKLAAEVLELAEIKHTQRATMFLQQTISNRYKEVSELVDSSKSLKPQRRKKSMRELMQQSVFHGAGWIGCNFIA